MKIICIGRNYVDHAKELCNEVPSEPVIFMKPDSAIFRQRDAFYIPDWTNDVHYEAEVVVRINRVGKNIEAKFAHKYYSECTVGIDFTARDVQKNLKAKGLPWEKAKGFDQSAVVGEFVSESQLDMKNLSFKLRKNDAVVQEGNTANMLYSIDDIIAHVSQYFTLKIGDLIFTGTPAGVGPVSSGDLLVGSLAGKELLRVSIR